MLSKTKKVLHFQREITFLQQLDQQQYFVHDLKRLDSSINVRIIRENIQKKLVAHFRNEVFISSSSWIFTSFLFSVIVFFFFVKSVIKSLFRSKRLQIATHQIIKNERELIEAAIAFDVNRDTLTNRVKNKRFAVVDYDKKCRLLNKAEKSAFLQFIDKYCKLDFSSKYEMIKDKIMKLRALRVENFKSIEFHWVSRFLNRHSDYKFRFSRYLNQKRHWNTEFNIFENWFKLYKQTIEKFHIVIDDVYNMNEKNYLIKVNKKC